MLHIAQLARLHLTEKEIVQYRREISGIISYLEHLAEINISKKELTFILKSEIENLPPVYKTLITLYHNEELSYEEIKEITGLPEGTLKSYLFRARKTLKENLLAKYKKEDL